MFKTLLKSCWDELCSLSDLLARSLTISALMTLFTWPVANKILWDANLPTLPFWWYWCMFNNVVGMKILIDK